MLPLNVWGAMTIFTAGNIIYQGFAKPMFSRIVDTILIVEYYDSAMPRRPSNESTRQIFASVREDLYLAAKARATELRIPLREFLERALELALGEASQGGRPESPTWGDEYLDMQTRQELGAPVELSRQEAERVVRGSFGLDDDPPATGSEDATGGLVT